MPVHVVVIGGTPAELQTQHPALVDLERSACSVSWAPTRAAAEALVARAKARGQLLVLVDAGAENCADLAGGAVLWAGSVAQVEPLVHLLLAPGTAQDGSADDFAHLGLILAGVVHDLRSPLSFMVSRAELGQELVAELRESGDMGELDAVETNLAHIEGHGRSAIELVHSVLDMAKGTTGGSARVVVDVALRRLVALFRPSRIELELELDAGDAEIAVGPRDFARILLNLLHNAQQALLQRGAEEPKSIRVSTRREAESVVLSVADNGTGVPPAARERIFQPSYSTTGSTGLGLAVVKRLVETHGATVELDADYDEGARFVLRFPRCV